MNSAGSICPAGPFLKRIRSGFVSAIPLTFPSVHRNLTRSLCRMTVENKQDEGVRINKCFASFASRRQADLFVEQGRVAVNGKIVSAGTRVHSGDSVSLDDDIINWERLALTSDTSQFMYIKHWKKSGTICTTDPEIPNNIVARIETGGTSNDRIFPVGRLDENSSGIILLTSDGRLPNAVLGARRDCSKEYIVTPDMVVSDEHLDMLRKGIVIKTVAQRDHRRREPLVSRTLPCVCERAGEVKLRILLKEGRNRQIRKMLGALGYTARAIHRISFNGITLEGLGGPGDWAYLTEAEVELLKRKLN